MQGWTADAIRKVPQKDERIEDEPGLRYFAERMAHVWEFYGGVRFNASKKAGGGADFVHGLLATAGFPLSLASVTTAVRNAVKQLDREHPDRIIVAPQDYGMTIDELVRRGPVPKKGKVSGKG